MKIPTTRARRPHRRGAGALVVVGICAALLLGGSAGIPSASSPSSPGSATVQTSDGNVVTVAKHKKHHGKKHHHKKHHHKKSAKARQAAAKRAAVRRIQVARTVSLSASRRGYNTAAGTRVPGSLVIGHKAGFKSAKTTQNSYLAATRTLAAENDIETDAQRTKDGKWYSWHDDQVRGCTGYAYVRIADMTEAQIKRVRCGGQPLASVNSIAWKVQTYPARTWYLELKHPAGESAADHYRDAKELVQILKYYKVSDQVIVDDFSSWVLPSLMAADPDLSCAYLDGTASTADVDQAAAYGCSIYSVSIATANRAVNNYARFTKGLRVNTYGTTSEKLARQAFFEGSNTVSNDDPVGLRARFGR